MNPLVHREQLARFLDLRTKVIVAADDVPLSGTGDPLFDMWVFAPRGGNAAVLRPLSDESEGDDLIALSNPPAGTCVLAATTDESRATLEPLQTWWIANSPCAVPLLCFPDRDRAVAGILRALLRAAQQELQETAAQATAASAQLYALRCENEQTRVVVEALQTEVLRLRQRPQLMTLHLPPTGRVYAPPGGRGAVVQPLEVSAEGMAGIDLHFPARAPIAKDVRVQVRLHALDMGRDLGAWLLRAPHLGKGWVRCWLPEVLGVASHNLELRVAWHGDVGISLASVGDWDEMSACTAETNEPVDGCLALTAWTGGVPGVPLKSGVMGCTPDADGHVEYSLNAEEIARMSLYVPPVSWKPDEWYPFQQRDDGSFMLHPIGPRATTLQLANGCPPGVDRVTAVVKITSPQARGDVEYAIAASRADGAGELLDQPDPASDPRFVAFSGWRPIPRDDAAHVIVMDFAEPLVEAAHLLLATRMPPGVDHAWAWADWLDVRLRVRGLQVLIIPASEQHKQKWAA